MDNKKKIVEELVRLYRLRDEGKNVADKIAELEYLLIYGDSKLFKERADRQRPYRPPNNRHYCNNNRKRGK